MSKDESKPYPNASGTLSISSTITSSISGFDQQIETLKSVVQANPTLIEYVKPAIDRLRETRNFVYHVNWQLIDSQKSELEPYRKIIEDYGKLINKKRIMEGEIQKFFEMRAF